MLRALVALVVPGITVGSLAEADFQSELSTNEQLRGSSPTVQTDHRWRAESSALERMSLLRRALVRSFALMSTAVVGATALRFGGSAWTAAEVRLLTAISIFCFAWATLGRLGWAGQSWDGDSVVERLDSRIFMTLYWIGTFLGTLAVL